MNILLVSSLLGAFVAPAAATEDAFKVTLSLYPPASDVFLYECVLLECHVHNSTDVWSIQWFRHTPHAALDLNPRYMKRGDIFAITAVSRDDAGVYWCQADRRDNNFTTVLLSRAVTLRVSEDIDGCHSYDPEPPSSSPVLSQDTRQIFRGSPLSLPCPESQSNTTLWTQRSFSDEHDYTTSDPQTVLLWCESTDARTNAVLVTSVDVAGVIIKTPTFVVPEGTEVLISCHHGQGALGTVRFFKDDMEITADSSHTGQRATDLKFHATETDKGLYKCVSNDGLLQSQGSWLSVKGTNKKVSVNQGSRDWPAVSCGIVLLLVIPLVSLLLNLYRKQMFSCWRMARKKTPSAGPPVTKQDLTEVQWDMEMSNLLEKQHHP